jgi:hypothetical protein
MDKIIIKGTYSDFKPLRVNPPEVRSQVYSSHSFNQELLGIINSMGSQLGIQQYQQVFKDLIDNQKILIFFTKDRNEAKYYSYRAAFLPIIDTIFVPFYAYVNKYQLEILAMLSTICHELAHMLYEHKPRETIQVFQPLLELFYKTIFFDYLKKTGVNITASLKQNIETMVTRFFITSDHGFDLLLSENFQEFLDQKKLPEDVKAKIMKLTYVITYANNFQHVRANPQALREFKAILDVMINVHCKLSRRTREDYNKARAGMPSQEISAPSEVISIQSQLNPLVRRKVLSMVNSCI